MDKTVFIVITLVAGIQLISCLLSIGKRKMVSYTIMTMLNDLANLSTRVGYKSWIDYYMDTYGNEKALIFLNQVYGSLEKNKIKDKHIDEVKKQLKEFLTLEIKRTSNE